MGRCCRWRSCSPGSRPRRSSFGAGQAAFTVTVLIIFNILQPAGWSLGLVRIEDVALGCAVSLVVGLLLWPRGAARRSGARCRRPTATARRTWPARSPSGSAAATPRCPARPEPTGEAMRAAASSRRLDDTFRGYLAERGAKPVALAEVTSLVTGVAGLRLAADAVLELWRDDGARAATGGGAARARAPAASG